MIHPTAIVHPKALVSPEVEIGPFCVVDEHVTLAEGCRLEASVRITGHTKVGCRNVFHTGCVIGDSPQDLKYKGEPTGLVIGDNNVFRENFTVHRSNKLSDVTRIGSNGFFMAGAHVGHNSEIGDFVILANGALVAGHVAVGDRAFISGNCLVHQFTRVGTLALMQGGAGVSKDVPPFTIATGENRICGLNVIGLRRAGFSAEERLQLKKLYHSLFRTGLSPRAAAEAASGQFQSPPCQTVLEFVRGARRGVCRHGRSAERESNASVD